MLCGTALRVASRSAMGLGAARSGASRRDNARHDAPCGSERQGATRKRAARPAVRLGAAMCGAAAQRRSGAAQQCGQERGGLARQRARTVRHVATGDGELRNDQIYRAIMWPAVV